LKNVNRWDNNIKIDLRKHKMVCGLDASGPWQDQVVGSGELCNKLLESIKCGEFLDQLRNY
jgi:hypothetical protein